MLINESATLPDDGAKQGAASSRLRVAGAIDLDGEPVAVMGMRLNSDALNDLVVLRSNASAPTVIMTSPAATFSVTNTDDSITAVATNPQGSTSEFSACVPYGAADLGVTKAASSATIIAGSSVTYTITLVNNGPDSALSITVTDNLPASLTFVSCASTGSGVCGSSGDNRIVSFSSLAPGASATITIGSIDYAVDANVSSIPRTGTVTIAGLTFTLMQAGEPCTFSIEPTGKLFGEAGSEASFTVTTVTECNWTTSTADDWIFITSEASGTGPRVVSYGVRDNFTGSPRQATITVGGLAFTIVQGGGTPGGCVYVLNPSSAVFNSAGGNGSVQIVTEASCAWGATTNVNWITLTSQIVGIGASTVTYNVNPNPGVSGRGGVIVIGGQSFKVKQKGN